MVGKEEVPMSIHAAALEGLSDPLNAMINNGTMKESMSKVAVFKDVDVEVYAAFCEFAYTGKFESTLANQVNEHLKPDQKPRMSRPSPLRRDMPRTMRKKKRRRKSMRVTL